MFLGGPGLTVVDCKGESGEGLRLTPGGELDAHCDHVFGA